ncbi:MAG: RNA polymerase sigma factor [Gemmataceae bacterium]
MPTSDESFGTIYLNERVIRWQGGDRAAADELIRAVAGRLERLARKMLRGFPSVRPMTDTGDLVAGATMRLLNALRSVRPASTREFFGLSALQMRRELLDLAAAAARRKTTPLEEDHADALTERATMADIELWSGFHEAVDGLPAEEREVVNLVFYHGWTQKQVAELLGVDERTVRRYWRSAVARLTDRLGGRLPGSD